MMPAPYVVDTITKVVMPSVQLFYCAISIFTYNINYQHQSGSNKSLVFDLPVSMILRLKWIIMSVVVMCLSLPAISSFHTLSPTLGCVIVILKPLGLFLLPVQQ